MKKRKPNPLLKGLPKRLKDPKNYKETMDKILAVMKSDHEHKSVASYVKCPECTEKREERKKVMKEIGFKSYAQYLEWRRTIEIMINQFKIPTQ